MYTTLRSLVRLVVGPKLERGKEAADYFILDGENPSNVAPVAVVSFSYLQSPSIHFATSARQRVVRFVIISDTHEFHDYVAVPDGDFLIHCGDILVKDRYNTAHMATTKLKAFFSWFHGHSHKHKIVIGGNHDGMLEKLQLSDAKALASPALFAVNELFVMDGITFFASPRSEGRSKNKAFTSEEVWTAFPTAPVDVLITHQGPWTNRMVDFISNVRPRLFHACGHEHDRHGLAHVGPTPSFNGAICQGSFGRESLQRPVVVDVILPVP